MWENYRDKYTSPEEMTAFLKNKGFTHIIYNNFDGAPVPEYVQLIIMGKNPQIKYGPVQILRQIGKKPSPCIGLINIILIRNAPIVTISDYY